MSEDFAPDKGTGFRLAWNADNTEVVNVPEALVDLTRAVRDLNATVARIAERFDNTELKTLWRQAERQAAEEGEASS